MMPNFQSFAFLIPALLGGCGLATIMAPIGTVLIWRRQSFYADVLAHGAVLGVGLAYWLQLPAEIGVILSSIFIGTAATFFQRRTYFTNDAVLNVLSYSSLASGLVLLKFFGQSVNRVDTLLFGDLLLLTPQDLAFIGLGALCVLGGLKILWKPLLQIAISPDLAHVQGISITRIDYGFRLLISIVIAIAFRYSGTLLLAALLILPALTARPWAKSPESMVIIAMGLGTLAIIGGLILSILTDWPTTPSIIIIAFGLFAFTNSVKH